MAKHAATVTIEAPVHQVYALFTHFNDYPKFMSFVLEVTYLDAERSHWVVDVVGRHEWDAINEDWIADRQVGWRSTNGLENCGRITFEPEDDQSTVLTATIEYAPPVGALGALGEALGAGAQFEARLQQDLENFARMVEAAPQGALDPTSSAYIFHPDSAASRGRTTAPQDRAMGLHAGREHAEHLEVD
jgi:uncharacterized membrane protein